MLPLLLLFHSDLAEVASLGVVTLPRSHCSGTPLVTLHGTAVREGSISCCC